MNCRTCCCRKFSLIFALLAMAIMAAPAFAGSADPCVQAAFGSHVVCTANDVRIAFADNPRHLDGTPFDATHGCTAGLSFSFVADFHVVSTATQRENIGLYFETQGSGNAVTGATGTCSDNIIAPPHHVPGDAVCLGSGTGGGTTCPTTGGTYEELDTTNKDTSLNEPYNITGGTTGCGEISTADNNQVITVEVDNAMCVAGANGMLLLPNAVSWQQQGGTLFCTGTGSLYDWDETKTAIPGSPSKCNHDDTFTVPIIVQSPTVSVSKTCDIGGGPLSSCDFGATSEGGTVTYTVTVTNTSNTGSIKLDQICDSAYGTIATDGSLPACATGTVGGTIGTGTPACSVPQTLQAAGQTGDSYTCQFTATQGELTTVKDTVTANGVGADGKTGFSGTSSEVQVKSGDVAATATINKTWVATKYACARVRYQVDVAANTDGPLTLTGLTDDGNDLTALSSNTNTNTTTPIITGTTCGVATSSHGLGTASDLLGGGAFSSINVGGPDYVCNFDAQFCGNVGPITGTTCPAGIQHQDTVNGTLTGDESETVSVSPGILTVNECITTTFQ
jgi:hypothetical protein